MTPPAQDPSLFDVYAVELRVHAITLIWLGYRRLDAPTLAGAEEDAITGELVREMENICEDTASPDWVEQVEVHEQTRQNVEGKTGKGRPIIDIEVRRHHPGPRRRLRFEAKRLGRAHFMGGYMGKEGLGAFLSEYYPTTHGEVGMLGYVQEKTCDEWSALLGKELLSETSKHRLAIGGQLKSLDVDATMPAFHSAHTDANDKPLVVIHIFLPFTI